VAAADVDPAKQWGQWRGPLATGEAPHADPPVKWSETSNVRWKVSVPGAGHSTPVVWGDRIFLTTAIPHGDRFGPIPDKAPGAHDNFLIDSRYKFVVLAVDRKSGKILWQRTVEEAQPHEGAHVSATLASASPVTDGKRVFAFFGSRGLYALDLEGKLLWQRDLGQMQSKHGHGEGASPALYKDTLVVNWDHEGQSFVVAVDTATGKDRWKVLRDEPTSWATPIVVEHNGKAQAIVSAANRVRSYDLSTGKVIWECAGLSHNVVASPVAADGMIYTGSSYEHQAMLAIRLDGAKGDITGTDNVVWTRNRRTPYVPSLLLSGGAVYYLNHYQGVLSRVVGKTGDEPEGPFRLVGVRNMYASPVAAAGRIYFTDMSGVTLVMTNDAVPKMLSVNALQDSFSASAALVGSELFLRGTKYLYCVAEEE
jgi:outer membrane protein assembly factor BamB